MCRKKQVKKEEKIPEPIQLAAQSNDPYYPGKKLFDKPFRINHLMEKNTSNPFLLQNSQKNYHKMNIMGICGPGIIMAEEDVVFTKGGNGINTDEFVASSTVKCKTPTGLLFAIRVVDLERETRTQVFCTL